MIEVISKQTDNQETRGTSQKEIMIPRKKKLLFGLLLIFLLGAGVAAYFFSFQPRRPVKEAPVRVIPIHPEGKGRGSLPQEAVMVDHLSGRAAIIRLTVEAGIEALKEKNYQETLRFLSPHYSDRWGFNARLMEQVVRRAFKEFDHPRIELEGPPLIRIQNNQALVSASIRLTAIYQGRRNYLLGNSAHPNSLWLQMGKTDSGWKLENVNGLRPLGFEEDFFKLLGAEVGLSLTEEDKAARQQACMPCRERMAERFGPYR